MAKIFETQFEKRLFIDKITWTQASTVSNVTLKKTSKWISLFPITTSSNYLLWTNINHSQTASISFCACLDTYFWSIRWWIIGNAWWWSFWYWITHISWQIVVEIYWSLWWRQSFSVWISNKIRYVTVWVKIDRINKILTIRHNWNINTYSFVEPWNVTESLWWITIWNTYWWSFTWAKNPIYKWIFWNELVSIKEFEKVHKWFVSSQQIEIQKNNFSYPKPQILRSYWLSWAWNMKYNKWKIYDISWNNRNITITGRSPTKKWLQQNPGATASLSWWFVSWTNWSMCFCINKNNSDAIQKLMWANATWINWAFYLYLNKLWYRFNSLEIIDLWFIYFKNWLINIVITYNWNRYLVYINWKLYTTVTPTWKTNTFSFITDSTYPNLSEFIDIRTYTREISLWEVKNYNNIFAEQLLFFEDFSSEKPNSVNIVPVLWQTIWWTFDIGIETANNPVLSTVKKWTKYLIWWGTTGLIYTPCSVVAWTWERDWMKTSTWSSGIKFHFMATKPQAYISGPTSVSASYIITIWSWVVWARQIQLLETVVWWTATIHFTSPIDYYALNTRYRMRVTRTLDWTFSVYIKWWSFWKDFVLVATASWSNPKNDITTVNSSIFMFSPLNINQCCITNICIYWWILV